MLLAVYFNALPISSSSGLHARCDYRKRSRVRLALGSARIGRGYQRFGGPAELPREDHSKEIAFPDSCTRRPLRRKCDKVKRRRAGRAICIARDSPALGCPHAISRFRPANSSESSHRTHNSCRTRRRPGAGRNSATFVASHRCYARLSIRRSPTPLTRNDGCDTRRLQDVVPA